MKKRLNRSELAVPGYRPELFEKASKSECDVVFLDLEDSVSIDKKKLARKYVVEAINDINWYNKVLSVRVNAIDTEYFEDDIQEIVNSSNSRLDLIMIPKVENSIDIKKIDTLLSLNEVNKGKKIGLELIIETAKGLVNIEEIANASTRNEALHFGAADMAASIGAKTLNIGGVSEYYGTLENEKKIKENRKFFLNDMWHYPLFKILVTARAFGLKAIDSPFGDYNDEKGFIALAKKSYSMGFDGKMVIHPKQIPLANNIYMPSEKEVYEAKQIIQAMRKAKKNGEGAIAFKGKLLDIVSIKQAENVVYISKQLKLEGKN